MSTSKTWPQPIMCLVNISGRRAARRGKIMGVQPPVRHLRQIDTTSGWTERKKVTMVKDTECIYGNVS